MFCSGDFCHSPNSGFLSKAASKISYPPPEEMMTKANQWGDFMKKFKLASSQLLRKSSLCFMPQSRSSFSGHNTLSSAMLTFCRRDFVS